MPLRDVWRHEALGLTAWLEENIDVVGEITGLGLGNVNRERAVGDFNVDLTAEDTDSGRVVVIENQLERSDHDHLGKVITYLAGIGGQVAIWIVKQARSEHVKAITWLNESMQGIAEFYLLQIEAVRIAESPPAPLLTKIVGPDETTREVAASKRERSEQASLRQQFWSSLLSRAKGRTKLHSNISPSDDTWIAAGSGVGGVTYNYVANQFQHRIELYIDKGKGNEAENRRIFDRLHSHREQIEQRAGGSFNWDPLDGRQACRITRTFGSGGYRSPESEWPAMQDEMIDAMIQLERGIGPYLRQ